MKIQRRLSNGKWVDVDPEQADVYVRLACNFERITRQEALDLLGKGKSLQSGTDWYDEIRAQRVRAPQIEAETVVCSCGHTIAKNLMMSASRGSSCPDCYDRMSD
ncbi:MAG TPA: hypothetical protein VLH56_08835 [Dissulfurispiraceae bacterium]|nr:hypothetical protein [Dissulfurispiraceae bacterium]